MRERETDAACSPPMGGAGSGTLLADLTATEPLLGRAPTSSLELHRSLSEYSLRRVAPGTPDTHFLKQRAEDTQCAHSEQLFIESERAKVRAWAAEAPSSPDGFLRWYQDLQTTGPGQNDSLFDWLQEQADWEQMRWFIRQEIAGEAGFEDLLALVQLRMPDRVKLELARNYWDEMGRGRPSAMHGPMLGRCAKELDIAPGGAVVWEALAVGNLLLGLAANRAYAYHAIGALGAVELTAPTRTGKVAAALTRLGLRGDAVHFYRLHTVVDVGHSEDWKREVIAPLVAENPGWAPYIAEGALMRLNAGAACFDRYREHFGLPGGRAQVG